MSELSAAALLQATALALLRHSSVDRGGAVPILALRSTAYSATAGRLEVTYAHREEPAVFEYAAEGDGVRYTCLGNRYALVLTPTTPIYEQE